jgi:hypothetical protein
MVFWLGRIRRKQSKVRSLPLFELQEPIAAAPGWRRRNISADCYFGDGLVWALAVSETYWRCRRLSIV